MAGAVSELTLVAPAFNRGPGLGSLVSGHAQRPRQVGNRCIADVQWQVIETGNRPGIVEAQGKALSMVE